MMPASTASNPDDWYRTVVAQQCGDLLALMLAAGQHRWDAPSAVMAASAVGLDPCMVKPGFSI